MKLKEKDFIIGGAFVLVGLLIYLTFFTNVVTGMFGIKGEETPTVENNGSGLDNFNFKVTEKKQEKEYKDKEEAFKDELKKEQEAMENQSIEEAKKKSAANRKMTDLNEFVEKDTKGKQKKLEQREDLVVQPVEKTRVEVKQQPQVVQSQPLVKQTVTSTEVKKAKRKRNKRLFDTVEVEPAPKAVVSKKEVQVKGNSVGKGSVYGPQTVDTGKRITFMLTEPLKCSFGVLDEGSLIDGTCSILEGRLYVKIPSVKISGVLHKVNGKVADAFDGLDGLPIAAMTDEQYVQKSVTSDAVQQTANRLGVPILGRAAQSGTQKKMYSTAIKLAGDEKVIIVLE